MSSCKFREGKFCKIGCTSKNVSPGSICPYADSWDPDELCPCHQSSLTFYLARRVEKILRGEINVKIDRTDPN